MRHMTERIWNSRAVNFTRHPLRKVRFTDRDKSQTIYACQRCARAFTLNDMQTLKQKIKYGYIWRNVTPLDSESQSVPESQIVLATDPSESGADNFTPIRESTSPLTDARNSKLKLNAWYTSNINIYVYRHSWVLFANIMYSYYLYKIKHNIIKIFDPYRVILSVIK